MLVSVIVPVYNSEKYLKECMESIVTQTYREIEVICVNDGSTDSSYEILQDFALRDSRIVLINKSNSGYGNSMNVAIDRATGDYISIVESDDYIDASMIGKLVEYVEKYRVDIVKTNYYLHTNDKDELVELFPNPPYDEVFFLTEKSPEILMGGGNIWTGLYRRSFLMENGIRFYESPGASYQDTGFKLKTFICAERILIKRDAYYYYRIDNMDASVKSKEKVYCVCEEMEDTRRFLHDRQDRGGVADFWLSPFKLFLYRWNLDRIDEQYKEEFADRMIRELRDDYDKGYVREQDFSVEDWRTLLYYIKLGVDRNIVIFGAGVYGKRNLHKLKELHIPVRCFCDNEKTKWGTYVENYKVESMDNIQKEYENLLFLIPDRPYKKEMEKQLEAAGISYVIL